MSRQRRPRFLALVAFLAVLSIPAGGVAYAFWSGTGTGTGAGAVGTTVALALSPGTPGSTLYPGGQSNVVLTVANANDSVVHVSSLSLNTAQGTSGYAVDGGHSGCTLTALAFSTQTNGGAGWDVPARVGAVNGTLPITLASSLAMSASAVSACQGATFTVYLVAG